MQNQVQAGTNLGWQLTLHPLTVAYPTGTWIIRHGNALSQSANLWDWCPVHYGEVSPIGPTSNSQDNSR